MDKLDFCHLAFSLAFHQIRVLPVREIRDLPCKINADTPPALNLSCNHTSVFSSQAYFMPKAEES